jgi:hypothetical protein
MPSSRRGFAIHPRASGDAAAPGAPGNRLRLDDLNINLIMEEEPASGQVTNVILS